MCFLSGLSWTKVATDYAVSKQTLFNGAKTTTRPQPRWRTHTDQLQHETLELR
jgi:hypothetical protein